MKTVLSLLYALLPTKIVKLVNVRRLRKKYSDVTFGENVFVGDGIKIGRGTTIGNDVILRGEVSIERGVFINSKTVISGAPGASVQIGAFCSIARDCYIVSANHPLSYPSTFQRAKGKYARLFKNVPTERAKITIGPDVWLGTRVIVLPGVSIGLGSVIGAGAVVTKDIPQYTVAGGVPARPIRRRFSIEVENVLNEIKWWTWSDEVLFKNKRFFDIDLDKLGDTELVKIINEYSNMHNNTE